MRHLMDYWEGTDVDADSGLSHITKAICSLIVWRDAAMNGMLTDDRPPSAVEGWLPNMNKKAEEIVDKYPNAKEACTRDYNPDR